MMSYYTIKESNSATVSPFLCQLEKETVVPFLRGEKVNAQKFQYICFSPHSSSSSNVYTSSSFDIINYSRNILDLGINVSSDCSFDFHISNLAKRTKHLTGWMLRTFSSRDKLTMLTLCKALVMSRLDYGRHS